MAERDEHELSSSSGLEVAVEDDSGIVDGGGGLAREQG